jgi:DNA polymerase III subunit beta
LKFIASAQEISQRLQIAAHIASGRGGLGIGGAVMVVVDDKGLELLATDLETSVRLQAHAKVEVAGRVVVPARLMLDIARMAPGDAVECELDRASQSLVVRSKTNVIALRLLREEDFPSIPALDGSGDVVLPGPAFVGAVNQVARAASRDETRPLLTGILLQGGRDRLHAVATDSYRLAVKEVALGAELAGDLHATVPVRALTEAARLVQQEAAGEVKVGMINHQIIFAVSNTMLASRMIDGHFPDYRQLLPDSAEHELRFATDELLEVVRRVGLVAQKNTPLRFSFKEGELTVSARTPDIGEASETIPSEFRGESLEIGFNPTFMRDGLESVGSPRLVLKLVSALRPGVIESEGSDDGGFLYLVMPVRLGA